MVFFTERSIFMKDYNRLHGRRRYQEMPYDCGTSLAKYLLCLFNFVFFVSMMHFILVSGCLFNVCIYELFSTRIRSSCHTYM
jgi:hypothetical protein